jgi:hypothetical protein|tara:strand:- start:238 stop:423 length:186 start_codon:yes stop_codon:yes gene_type:complete
VKKGYATHRRTPVEIVLDLGELGTIIHQLPADSSERRSLERLEMQIKNDLHTSIGYEVENN